MNIAFLSVDLHCASIALHLQEEGHNVYVGQCRAWSDVKVDSKESGDDRRKRLSLYDGLLKNKWPIEKLMSFLLGQPSGRRHEWIVISDFNWMWPYADRLRKAGFVGLLPTRDDYMLEHDRKYSRDVITKLYPEVETGDYHEFKKVKDAIAFLEQEQETFFVLKGFNCDAETVVPTSDDFDDNRAVLIDTLERDKDHNYEKDGFILEEHIGDAIEFTPEAIAFNGELTCVNLDVEHKRIGSRSGPMTGCALGAVLWQDENTELYERFLKPLEQKMLRPNELTIWDLSLLYSPSREAFYAGEFCPNRMGYDAVFTEIASFESATDWLTNMLVGGRQHNPVAVSLRVFNLDKKEYLFIGDPADRNVWPFDLHKEGDNLYVSGYGKDAYVLTASGNGLEEAIDKLYKTERYVEFEPAYFLQRHDWFDEDYQCNILHRIQVLKDLQLITEENNHANQENRHRRNNRTTETQANGQNQWSPV